VRYLFFLLLIVTTSCKSSKISNRANTDRVHAVPACCGVDCMEQTKLFKNFENILYTRIDTTKLQVGINFFIVNREIEPYLQTIDYNINELNSSFHGVMEFRKNRIEVLSSDNNLPLLYQDYLDGGKLLDNLSEGEAEPGFINVFVVETREEDPGRILHGFTPLYNDYYEGYAKVVPKMDRLMISFEGLEFKSSLFHELGHYFSLAHPWELSEEQKHKLGLIDPQEECINHMNYNCFVNKFTEQQLQQMKLFAYTYRAYLGIAGNK